MSTPRMVRALACAGLSLFLADAVRAQSVAITSGIGTTESFDSLTGSGTGSTLPTGWFIAETGTGADTTYAADNGTDPTGNTYSYGATGAVDRALGTLQTGAVVPTIGAKLSNSTGATLSTLFVDYVGEEWRLGANPQTDRLQFQYSTNATSLTTGTWTSVPALDFVAPVTTGTPGILNGNLSGNRSSVDGSITGLALANGATLWVRWVDFHAASGAEDGLALDDVRFGTVADPPPSIVTSVPANNATGVSPNATLILNFSEQVNLTDPWFTLSCSVSGARGGQYNQNTITQAEILPNELSPGVYFSLGDVCDLTVLANGVTDSDGTHNAMVANVLVHFSVSGDAPPTVLTTAPADNATGVDPAANFVVNFSEPVATVDPWVTLSCGITGNHFGSSFSSNGGATWTFDPASGFVAGESCTATIARANVHDLDGTADALIGSNTFRFTAQIDSPPTVTSTSPANGAGNISVAANLGVTFSEPVTAPVAAFQVTCVSSGSHAFALTGGPTTFTLNPTVDFDPLESCTLQIRANQVEDTDGTPTAMTADVNVQFTTSASVAQYYADVDTTTCTTLRTTLHKIIKDHVAFPFDGASGTTSWTLVESADQDPANAGKVLDVYRNRSYTKLTDRAGAADGLHYAREQAWPSVYGFNGLSGTDGSGNPWSPYTDAHDLFVAAADYRSDRGSKPYASCTLASGCTERTTDVNGGNGGGSGSYPGHSNWFKAGATENLGSFEVFDARKGDLARALMYMDLRYDGGVNSNTGQAEPDLVLTDNRALITTTASGSIAATAYMGLLANVLTWHAGDPPSAAEQLRNDVVYSYQGNRNPFIDHPEYATCLFSCVCPKPDPVFKDSFE